MRNPLLLAALCFGLICAAQNPFQKIIDADDGAGRAVTSHSNGDLTIAATYADQTVGPGLQVVRYDFNGTALWSTIVQLNSGTGGIIANDMISTNDGGTIIVGEHVMGPPEDSAFVVKIDASGMIIWAKRFALDDTGALSSRMESAYETDNGDVILVGQSTVVSGGIGQDLIIARITSNGMLLWSKRLEHPGLNTINRPGPVTTYAGGNIMVTGQVTQGYEGNFQIAMDPNGQIISSALYKRSTLDAATIGIRASNPGGTFDMFVAHNFPTSNAQLYKLKVDPAGTILDALKYRIPGLTGTFFNVKSTGTVHGAAGIFGPNGIDQHACLALFGDTVPPSGFIFKKPNSTGRARRLAPNYTGGFSLTGTSTPSSTPPPTNRTLVLNTDMYGSVANCDSSITVIEDTANFTTDTITFVGNDIFGWVDALFGQTSPAYSDMEECNPNTIDQLQNNVSIKIHPNPASDRLLLSDLGTGNWVHTLFNSNGQVVIQSRSNADRKQIDVSHYPEGIYLLQSRSDDRIVSNRIVLHR